MDDFYVVGIGASAGSLEAVQQFFTSMPPVENMAFVVIQHPSSDYKSYMPELLACHTGMPVHKIKNGMHIEPGCIYLNPPKYNVIINENHFELIGQDPPPRVNMAIDAFLESLAASKQERSIGIILSGTGSDGTRGCRAVKEAGGIVIVQDETAKFKGMPKSVISMKHCDYILPPRVMPEVLLRYSGSPVELFGDDTVDKLQERMDKLEQELRYTKESLRISEEENAGVRRLLEEAMTFDNLKDDFFSNISHEIRTPLNVIMSTLQLLESQIRNSGSKPDGIDLKKHIGIIRQNCYRQLRLINNMIDITKMDSGFYEVKMSNQNIVGIVENITLSVSDYAKAKSIDLIFDTDVEEKIIACCPDCIERIMLNLLSNAVKFTEKGGSINVNMYDRHDQIQICVKDTGVGIPDGKLDIIFDRFRQVDKSLTRAHEGSGIGLSLVKSLVELHNGNISIKSKYGAGSEFIITLPVSTVSDDTENIGSGEAVSQQSNVERINLEFSDVYGVS